MENGYSYCSNKWALDKDIKNELGLLLIISSLCAERGYCFASNKYLADLFQTNETLISRKLKKLEDKNYIQMEYEKQGTQVTNRYIRLSKTITDRYLKSKPTVIENDKENITSINNISINNKEIYKESFEELWKLYPNKKGKTESYKKFVKAIKEGISIETIRDGIQRYIDYIEIEHIKPQYIKNGSTWFNQRCWEDDYSTNRKPTTRDIAPKIKYMDFLKEDSND